ncbi:hypothetical protein KXX19_009742 [Aspergillus fumigatus]|nr:hypothetical protein KXX19_009742 [Aspergillus fumigatus]
MAQSQYDIPSTDHYQPPGTFLLIQNETAEIENHVRSQVILHPVPSRDPNEPLNWSTARKVVNFTLVLAVTVVIFTTLSVQVIFWQLMVSDMNVTYGLHLLHPPCEEAGTLAGIPRFEGHHDGGIALVCVDEISAGVITIADLFFVHHRGGMNALYMAMVRIGSFLTPMAAGTQATREGWRASYRALGIADAVLLGLFIFFYEETKYTQVVMGVSSSVQVGDAPNISVKDIKTDRQPDIECTTSRQESDTAPAQHRELDYNIPLKTWRQRLALVSYTAEPIWPYFHRPFIGLSTFPAVLFCALQYALGVVWLTILSSVVGLVFPLPPYNFTPQQDGFMSIGPFVGNLLGWIYGGFLGDRSILFFARRNKGYYEPETRLYILHLPALTLAGDLIMFGTTIARGLHWISPSIAGALFGFGLGSIGDAALTLVIDSYRDITGDAFTGVAFLRNAISIGIPFAISPWLERSGAQNMFLTYRFVSLAVTLTIIPMVLYGRKMRMLTAARYRVMAGLRD